MRPDAIPARPHVVNLTAFGSRITSLREGKGWSCRALARRLGLHPERLRRLERGDRPPFLDELTKLAAELEVSLDALVYGIGPGPEPGGSAGAPAAAPEPLASGRES